jgi:hypothetical protein
VADDPLCLQLPLPALLQRLAPCSHGPDFCTIRWNGQRYTFTATQRAIVRQLWAAWESGNSDMGQEALLAGAESESDSIADLFRGKHPAWGVVIIQGDLKGTYRLAEPES